MDAKGQSIRRGNVLIAAHDRQCYSVERLLVCTVTATNLTAMMEELGLLSHVTSTPRHTEVLPLE